MKRRKPAVILPVGGPKFILGASRKRSGTTTPYALGTIGPKRAEQAIASHETASLPNCNTTESRLTLLCLESWHLFSAFSVIPLKQFLLFASLPRNKYRNNTLKLAMAIYNFPFLALGHDVSNGCTSKMLSVDAEVSCIFRLKDFLQFCYFFGV